MSARSARHDVNERHIAEAAQKISTILTTAYGVMSRWTPEAVESDLRTGLLALERYPDSDRTHGLVSLSRSPITSTQFTISINLGDLTYFPEEEEK